MEPIRRMLIAKDGTTQYIRSIEKEYHSKFGVIAADHLQGKDGAKITTNTGKELFLLSPSYIDIYRKVKRGAQIITLKDIAAIIAETGIGKESTILDAGAGTGALACFLAHIAQRVTTYELREDFVRLVQENIDFLSLKNIEIKHKDVYEGIDETDLDLITLDVPEPWRVIDHAAAALKPGGFLVAYTPSTTQASSFVNAIHGNERFTHVKTVEVLEREWEIDGKKVRPKFISLGHTGFLSFARKLQ